MAKTRNRKAATKGAQYHRIAVRWFGRAVVAIAVLAVGLVALWGVINPPFTAYILSERWRLGAVSQDWVPLEAIAPDLARSVVAAEDANFCNHWGFDLEAIKRAIDAGGHYGASTLTQQTVKNVFLWHGRSYVRKALEAGLTPMVEALWTKRRIVEVYLNIAEFDTGVFGVKAAASHYFGVSPDRLTAAQAARLAAVLPSPKTRSAAKPAKAERIRALAIMDGAATIGKDGRSTCFES
jgi:monofunctional biosynthetic peptidoglycan transglycosylase